eukprot:scaffold785_cov95-Cylindrotheca_fusiformis.AAC.4
MNLDEVLVSWPCSVGRINNRKNGRLCQDLDNTKSGRLAPDPAVQWLPILGCFDSAFCATIDVIAADLDPSIEGAEYGNIYVLWDQKDRRVTATGDQRQQRPRRTAPTPIVSWEHDDALDESTTSSPYRINAQVRITSEEIMFCDGGGNVTGNLFQSCVRNAINSVFEPLVMRVFDSSGDSCNSQQPTSDIPGRYYGFTSIARNPQATPLTFVSSWSSNCTEPTEFESFPYLWKGSYEIFQIDVNSNGSLELVGNCVNDLGEKT